MKEIYGTSELFSSVIYFASSEYNSDLLKADNEASDDP